jgi:hypothetical protein
MAVIWTVEGECTSEHSLQPGVTQVSLRLSEEGDFVPGHAAQLDMRLRDANGDRFRRKRRYRVTFEEID